MISLRFGEKNKKKTRVLARAHTLCGMKPSKTQSILNYFSTKKHLAEATCRHKKGAPK
jgi:hypothetical protein